MVRFKNRYILVELRWREPATVDPSLDSGKILRALRNQISNDFGDWGLGAVSQSLQVKYFNHQTNMCIIRCPRDHYQMVWSALTLMTALNERPLILASLHVAGTIRSCQKAAIQHDRKEVAQQS
ncbi:Ribonuclease P/MRP protein subunit POP5 [Balamuthia mandrillaris]